MKVTDEYFTNNTSGKDRRTSDFTLQQKETWTNGDIRRLKPYHKQDNGKSGRAMKIKKKETSWVVCQVKFFMVNQAKGNWL